MTHTKRFTILRATAMLAMTGAVLVGANVAEAQKGRSWREQLTWSDAAGKPSLRDDGGAIYIWHDGNTVKIATTSGRDRSATIRATVEKGSITDVHRVHDERGDTIRWPSSNTVEFSSRTKGGLDEMNFQIRKGRTLIINVDQGRGHRPIYVGKHEIKADSGRIAIEIR